MLKGKGLLRRTLGSLAILVFAVSSAGAADAPVGKVTIETMSIGVGLSIADVGAAKVVARGEVYNLKRVEDFTGMFVAASAGATIGAGAGAAAMKNQNQVDMVWTATHQGLNFSLAHSGLNVKLTEEARQQAARIRRDAATTDGIAGAAPRTP
jgi:hypothetical protein